MNSILRKKRPSLPWRKRLPAALFALALCTLESGCLVLSNEWRYRPQGRGGQVESHQGRDGKIRSGVIDTADFKLSVAVENGPLRWEAPFLFWVIPIPIDYSNSSQSLVVTVELEPKAAEVSYNPYRTFFIGTNNVRVAPAHVWQNPQTPRTNHLEVLPIVANASFHIEFYPWDQVYPDRARSFQVLLEGLGVSNRTVTPISVGFRPGGSARLGFQLPY